MGKSAVEGEAIRSTDRGRPADRLDGLPQALVTGHRELDFEHALLLDTMRSLRSICAAPPGQPSCAGCQAGDAQRCDRELVAMLGDLLAFILEHFRREEQIMRSSLLLMLERDQCLAHMEDHAAISSKVQQIIARLDTTQTRVLIAELDTLLRTWVDNHIALHDLILARWVQRKQGAESSVTGG